MKLDAKIDFRCTKEQKETYKAIGGAKYMRGVLDSQTIQEDEIIYQEGTKLFKKVPEK